MKMNWYKLAQYERPEEIYAKSIGVNPESLNFIGKGDFGEAYEIPDGKIIKVTNSDSEASIAKSLIGKETAFAKIYDVKTINSQHIILQEKLKIDPSIEYKFHQLQDILQEQGLPIQYIEYLDEDELSPENKITYEQLTDFINAIEDINTEYRRLGIEASDIRPENLGYDENGVLKAFDIDNRQM